VGCVFFENSIVDFARSVSAGKPRRADTLTAARTAVFGQRLSAFLVAAAHGTPHPMSCVTAGQGDDVPTQWRPEHDQHLSFYLPISAIDF
jgi:hypothetical protein